MDCIPVAYAETNGVSPNITDSPTTELSGIPSYIIRSVGEFANITNKSIIPQPLVENTSSETEVYHITGSGDRITTDDVENFLYSKVIITICILGVLGNILNLIVLTRKGLQKTMDRMEKSAHYGLVALAISDILFCILVLPHAWVDKSQFFFASRTFDLYYIVYEHGIINAFIMSSTWLTVAMATSRYLAICHPLQARDIIGMTFAKVSIASVFLLCIIFNLPRFWLQSIDTMDCVGGWSVLFIHRGPLKMHPAAESAYMWTYFVIGILIPLLALAYCNYNLIRALQESNKLRQQYKHAKSSKDTKNHITLTLIIIVILYFILVLPAEIINFLKKTQLLNVANMGSFNVGVAIVNTLQAINFSFNFVLYCAINVHFRRSILDMFCCCFRNKKAFSQRYVSVTSVGSASATRNTAFTEC